MTAMTAYNSQEKDSWKGRPLITQQPGRWDQGRGWNGIGDWCDPTSALEASRECLRMAWEATDMNLTQYMDHLMPYFKNKRALTYLDVKGREIDNQSFAEVYEYASRIGAYIQRELGCRPGDRVILLYPPGQEFIMAFMGCVRAGVVAVPVYPPHPYKFETDVPRLNLIVQNCGARVALTDSQYMMVIRSVAVKNVFSRVGLANAVTWPSLRNVQTDKVRKSYAHTDLLIEPHNTSQDLCFLQYTSGSTSAPKGVMVTHGNIIAQIRLIAERNVEVMGLTNQRNVVSWLPQYHDMGLIGMFLTCLFTGVHLVYMTPISFLQDPTQWLRACHNYRAAATCAPNFAFALAERKTSEELRDSLDLSCIKVVVCGAEPIRVEVMESFNDYFHKSGYDPKALMPSYGLAEFTLCATTQVAGKPMSILYVDQHRLGAEGVVAPVRKGAVGSACYVGLGDAFSRDGSVCKIVHPETREDLGEGRVGEVWVDGPSKTYGYFDDPEKTAAAFNGIIKGEEDSGHVYLQTGDQGFLYKGSLFLTGRIKDLIIIRGRNLYPQDIEYALEDSLSELLRPGCSGSFSRDAGGEETVVYVAELREKISDHDVLQEAVDKARRTMADVFQVALSAVVLVEPRSIPKTTSGKIQRHKCREGFANGKLKELYRWEADAVHGVDILPKGPLSTPALDHFVSCRSFQLSDDEEDMEEQEGIVASGRLPSSRSFRNISIRSMEADRSLRTPETVPETSLPEDEEGNEEAFKTAEFIERLTTYVIQSRGMARGSIDIDQPMAFLGFDSAGFVALGKIMGDWVGKEIPPAIVYRYTTIRQIAGFLARGADESELSQGVPDDAIEADLESPIAIVGMSCRLPGGAGMDDLVGKDAFWRFVMDGKDAVREDMPEDRKAYHQGKLPGAYLNSVDSFDAAFFGFSPAEASHLDYHQSMVLQTAWHALEDAGIDPSKLSGRMVGTYVGAISHEFAVLQAFRNESSTFAATGVSNSLIANRLSYVLNVRGPSVVVDTACSSSLVAVHDAVRDLRLGACSMAIAGGVNLILNSETSAALKRAGFLSSACRTFDSSAEGYCRGEGCGMLVLKRVDRALAEGDRIYAVIRGSAVDHDGRTTSLTAPNPLAQETVIRSAYRDAHINPMQVNYIEAHGTGTRLGDSIETSALGAIMSGRSMDDPCILASAKSNIGHLEAAAGVMGIIRATLILHHRMVPKAVHFNTPNPLISWDKLPFKVPTENMSLERDDPGATLYAGVSSFGFGGTNAHLVLESIPQTFDADEDFETVGEVAPRTGVAEALPLLLPISARSEGALRRLAQKYVDLLENCSGRYDRAMAVCMDAGNHRTHHHGFRMAAIGRNASELKDSITTSLTEEADKFRPISSTPQNPEVCFLFTGQGAGYVNMARQLYERNAIFHANMDECDALFQPLLDGNPSILKEVVLTEAKEPITRTLLTQPTLFAIEYAMARVWIMFGIEPQVVMGHSVGEVVAAVVAGCMSLEDGAKLICARASAMDAMPTGTGGMTVVFATKEVVEDLIHAVPSIPPLEIAAVNGESCINVAGPLEGLNQLEALAKGKSVSFTRLAVSHAFHSSAMEDALPPMRQVVEGLNIRPPRVRLISLVTGTELIEAPGPDHWANNVRKPVLFLDGLRALTDGARPRVLIELGPDAALTAMARRSLSPDTMKHVALIPSMTKSRRGDENLRVMEAFGAAYVGGVPLKFSSLKIDANAPMSVDLPLYPFDESVFVSLGELTGTAVSRMQGTGPRNAGMGAMLSLPKRDYGLTYLFEESWLPRLLNRPRWRVMVPNYTVYICSEPIDASYLIRALAPTQRTYCVVVPSGLEAETRSIMGSNADHGALRGVDFDNGGDEIKTILRGPATTVSTGVVFVSSAAISTMNDDYKAVAQSAFRESGRLLMLLRYVMEMGLSACRMWVVTTKAKNAIAGDRVQSMGSTLWALTKSALQEGYPSLWATLIDLPGVSQNQLPMLPSAAMSGTKAKGLHAAAVRFIDLMDNEARNYTVSDPPEQLAYRHGGCLVQRLHSSWLEAELNKEALEAAQEAPLGVNIKATLNQRDGGWYLVTGGLGGLGLHCAAALVRHGARKLILTNRRGVVPEQYKETLDALKAMPEVEIRCAPCNTCERESVFKLFAESPGGIRGVVHCAGVLIDGNLRTQSMGKLQEAWCCKVDGALYLHEASLSQPRPLELFVMYSSSSALMGSPGESSYAAANSALDALAYLRRQQHLAATSIQWGSWRGVGFALPSFLELLEDSGFPPITKSLGGLVLTTLLNHSALSAPTVVCCHPVQWNTLLFHGPQYMLKCDLSCFPAVKDRIELGDESDSMTEDMKAYSELSTAEARLAMVEDAIIDTIHKSSSKVVTKTQNLNDVGIASLEAVEMVERLRKRFPINIEVSRLLEYPTVAQLATYLTPQLDRVADGNQSLVLCKGQQQAIAMGLSHAFQYIEQTMSGGIVTNALLSAWGQLVGRHDVLRTVIDLTSHKESVGGGGRQRVLPASKVTVADTFSLLPNTGLARDLSSLEAILGEAATAMANVPPARLLLIDSASTIYIAISRLLIDDWSLRLLDGELLQLYKAQVSGGTAPLQKGRTMFTEEVRRMMKEQPAPTLEETGTYAMTHGDPRVVRSNRAMCLTRSASSGRSLPRQPSGLGIVRSLSRIASLKTLLPTGSLPIDLERLELPKNVAMDLDRYAIKHEVPPAAVLLGAYAVAVADEMRGDEVSIAVDIQDTHHHKDIVGPLSVPFTMAFNRDETCKYPRALASHVKDKIHDGLASLEGPAWLPSMQVSQDLPGFSFQEQRLGSKLGTVGSVRPQQILQLHVTASLSPDGDHTNYDLRMSTGPYYSMDGLATLLEKVAFNVRRVVSRDITRSSTYSTNVPMFSGLASHDRGSDEECKVGVTDISPHDGGGESGYRDHEENAGSNFTILPSWAAALIQLLGFGLMGTVLSLPVVLVWPLLQAMLNNHGLYPALALTPLVIHLMGMLMCGFTLLLRQVLTRGWLAAGNYPVNSLPHLRWWFMSRLVSLLGPVYTDHLRGTILYTWWLRWLGADIGDNVRILGGAQLTDPDLVIIENDAVVGKGARLCSSFVREGVLHRGVIRVKRRGNVGSHAMMMPGSVVSCGACLRPQSLAVEDQVLTENGVFEGSPAYFVKPRQDVGQMAFRPRTKLALALEVLAQLAALLLAPIINTLSSAFTYPLIALMAEQAGIFPFFRWTLWREGALILALFTSLGVVPLLAFASLLYYMTFQTIALELPDAVLSSMARSVHLNITPSQFRGLFHTNDGVQAIRNALPAGTKIFGTPGTDSLMFSTPGKEVLHLVSLDAFGIPTATVYGIVGVLWVFVVAFLLQGFFMAMLTAFISHLLRLPTSSAAKYRVYGADAYLRQIRVNTLRYVYDRFMRLFAGSGILPLWYWAMGMKVGFGVVMANLDVIEDPHLVSLGDGAMLLDFATLDTVVEPGNGYAIRGGIKVGKEGLVGIRAVMGPGTDMEDRAVLMPLSAIATGLVQPNAVMMGVPAMRAMDRSSLPGNAGDDHAKKKMASSSSSFSLGIFLHGFFTPLILVAFNVLCIMIALYPPTLFLFWAMNISGGDLSFIKANSLLPLAYVIFSLSLLVLVVVEKWLFRGRVQGGSLVRPHSLQHYTRALTLMLQTYAATATLDTLRGSVWAPLYLFLLGAKAHPTAYINSLHITDHDLVELGPGAVVDYDSTVMAVGAEEGGLRLGKVRLEAGARMGSASVALRDTFLQPESELAEGALLPPSQGVRFKGVRYGATTQEPLMDEAKEEAREGLVRLSVKV